MSNIHLVKLLAKSKNKSNKIELSKEEINLPKEVMTTINSGAYNYKILFEGKEYPHSVNITKLLFRYNINNKDISRVLYLSTGHSFAESKYITNENILISKTNKIDDIFTKNNENIFFSLDNGFNDFALIYFGNLNVDNSNHLNNICKNMNIKFLENEIFIKNSFNTGETLTKAIINFKTDNFLITNKNNTNYFTFKINGKIIILNSKYSSGIIVKGINSKISKFNGEIVSDQIIDQQLEYYFYNILDNFKNHELFNNFNLNIDVKKYYEYYKKSNTLSVVSMMGDSGCGFYRIMQNNELEFIGININGCSMVILVEDKTYLNKNNNIYYDININKLRVGKYIIEEVHKTCQILPINEIKELVNEKLPNFNIIIN